MLQLECVVRCSADRQRSLCSYPELITVAAFILDRLRRLAPASAVVYNGLPLNETLILDGAGRLCVKEANTLYLVRQGSQCLISSVQGVVAEQECACRGAR